MKAESTVTQCNKGILRVCGVLLCGLQFGDASARLTFISLSCTTHQNSFYWEGKGENINKLSLFEIRVLRRIQYFGFDIEIREYFIMRNFISILAPNIIRLAKLRKVR
jgi:hypothetical protein